MVTKGRIMGEISLSLRKSLNATFSRKYSFICKPTPRDETSPSLSSRTLYIPHFLVFICFYLVFMVICGSCVLTVEYCELSEDKAPDAFVSATTANTSFVLGNLIGKSYLLFGCILA